MTQPDDDAIGVDRPAVPVDDSDLAADCAHDRSKLTPHETADCAGMDLIIEYDNEEDGGS